MSRPIIARIDTAAFRHNYLLAKSRAPGARAWAVVKANAYGHGLLRCAEAVRDVADGFALLEIGEAVQLRDAGFRQPIVLLEGFFAEDDLHAASEYGISSAVHGEEQLRMLELSELSHPLDVFVKLNTGMNRLGFSPARLPQVLARLRASGKVGQISVMTHFACADGEGIKAQLTSFDDAVHGAVVPVSVANSAALLRYPESHRDWVRPGIMLYGGSPIPDIESAAAIGLKPVMTLSSRIISVQEIGAGDAVGYSATLRADGPMRVGTVACGYADGYPRHANTGTPILVNGRRTRTIGRVSMDMLACDLTGIDAGVGSEVTLWGEGMPADEVAAAAGTVSYELFCALAQRVPVVEF
ncbi:alanine racemase [Uliginosibacterium paludis]|uniref:Alanine racemase n=1 Tax=Uliginosibacterium paludis TaxID=1615952 RepID=A0ABV2CTY6_9RHOO